MKMVKAIFASVMSIGLMSSVAFSSDTNSDFKIPVPSKESVKGLIVRVARDTKGEANLSSADYKIDTGAVKISEKKELESGWDKSFDVKGSGELTKNSEISKDQSNCGRCWGYRYHHNHHHNYNNYYSSQYYFAPVYTYTYYSTQYVYYYYATTTYYY